MSAATTLAPWANFGAAATAWRWHVFGAAGPASEGGGQDRHIRQGTAAEGGTVVFAFHDGLAIIGLPQDGARGGVLSAAGDLSSQDRDSAGLAGGSCLRTQANGDTLRLNAGSAGSADGPGARRCRPRWPWRGLLRRARR